MIEDLKKYNEKLFNELDNNLYAEDGSVVDVYVDIVPNLYSDTYSRMSTLREFEERRDLDGLTVLTPTKSYTSVDFQTGESKTITQFTSPYGKNTVLLVVDRLVVDKGMTLSHEGGHALYNVRNLSYYIEWLTKNPGASVGGHGGGNPSGKEAD
jgi:hypothetical protein